MLRKPNRACVVCGLKSDNLFVVCTYKPVSIPVGTVPVYTDTTETPDVRFLVSSEAASVWNTDSSAYTA